MSAAGEVVYVVESADEGTDSVHSTELTALNRVAELRADGFPRVSVTAVVVDG